MKGTDINEKETMLKVGTRLMDKKPIAGLRMSAIIEKIVMTADNKIFYRVGLFTYFTEREIRQKFYFLGSSTEESCFWQKLWKFLRS